MRLVDFSPGGPQVEAVFDPGIRAGELDVAPPDGPGDLPENAVRVQLPLEVPGKLVIEHGQAGVVLSKNRGDLPHRSRVQGAAQLVASLQAVGHLKP